MRLLYALLMVFIWAIIASNIGPTGVSADAQFMALAIMIAGAMAGGDGGK